MALMTVKVERVNPFQTLPCSNPFTVKMTHPQVIHNNFITFINTGLKVFISDKMFFQAVSIHPKLTVLSCQIDEANNLYVAVTPFNGMSTLINKDEDIAKLFLSESLVKCRFLEIVEGKLVRFGDTNNTMREVK